MWLPKCWFLILLAYLQFTNSAYLRCYRGSMDNYDAAPLESAESLLLSSCYNSSLPNAIYTFGFMGTVDCPGVTAVLNTLIALNDRNVFLLDWQKEARSIESLGIVGMRLSYEFHAIPNSVMVALSLGRALYRMSDNGFDLNKTHLIGHSLGAHVFGGAGRHLNIHGKILDRITGLDPARPRFEQPQLFAPLGSECANFVDTIHTFPGDFCLQFSYATVDIYVNYGSFIPGSDIRVQPGCLAENLMETVLCSHNRVWELLVEAWTKHHTLLASKASNYLEWEAIGNSTQTVYIGDDIDRTARGNFYLTTNAEPPYGKGTDGLHP